MRALLSTILAVAGAGCSLLVSVEGLSGVTSADAGPQTSDGSPEAAQLRDADPEPSGEDGATSASFCETQRPTPSFCADFDRTSEVSEGWTGGNVAAQGRLELDTRFSVSAPRAARATGANADQAQLIKAISSAGRSVHIEFSVRFEKFGANGAAEIVALLQKVSGVSHALVLYVTSSRAFIQDDPPSMTFELGGGIPVRQWRRVILDVANGSPATFNASIEGLPRLTQTLTTARSDAPIEFYFGLHYLYQSTDSWDMSIDDVVVDVK